MKHTAITILGSVLASGLLAQLGIADLVVTGGSSSVTATAGLDGPGLTASDSATYAGTPSFASSPSSAASPDIWGRRVPEFDGPQRDRHVHHVHR